MAASEVCAKRRGPDSLGSFILLNYGHFTQRYKELISSHKGTSQGQLQWNRLEGLKLDLDARGVFS